MKKIVISMLTCLTTALLVSNLQAQQLKSMCPGSVNRFENTENALSYDRLMLLCTTDLYRNQTDQAKISCRSCYCFPLIRWKFITEYYVEKIKIMTNTCLRNRKERPFLSGVMMLHSMCWRNWTKGMRSVLSVWTNGNLLYNLLIINLYLRKKYVWNSRISKTYQ